MTLNVGGPIRDVVRLWAAFFISLIVSRFIEYGLVRAHHSLDVVLWKHQLMGLLHDLGFSLLLSIACFGTYLVLFALLGRTVAFWGTLLSLVLLAFGHLALIRYYTATLLPLGRDFWAYELTELMETVETSGADNTVFWGCALVLVTVCMGGALLLRRCSMPDVVPYSLIGLALASLFVSPPRLDVHRPAAKYLAPNKTAHFFAESVTWAFGSESAGYNTERAGPNNTRTACSSSRTREYPWMYRADYDDVLGPFFDQNALQATDRPPNLVFIVFEGLGKAFVGKNAPYGGFTPFVDSLAQESLYWKNVLSTTGRTFGLMPSLFGSLPFADRGFMAMGADMPRHQTLIRLLGERGYDTHYYSGFNTSFDNVGQFLKRQQIDRIVDDSVLRKHSESDFADQNWGYPDKEMFSIASSLIDTVDRQPRLEIFHTLQTHDPYVVPNPEKYNRRFERRLRTLSLSENEEARYRTYQSELTTLLYTDEALRQFFEWYRAQPSYEHTIFVITGDHRLISVPQATQVDRYHVPFLIHSPLLSTSTTFSSVSTHADVTPTLLGFLQENTDLSFPGRAHWLGTQIDTTRRFRNVHSMALMRNKNELIDYLHRDYYLADEQLYRLTDGMALTPVANPEKQAELEQRMAHFGQVNQYVTQQNKLYSPEVQLSQLPPTTPFRAASIARRPRRSPAGDRSRARTPRRGGDERVRAVPAGPAENRR